MIPILYGPTETAFTSNGICRLPDCGMCLVTEERNGVYECQFTYPINGSHYADIKEGRIIFVTHDETGRGQPFDIYARTEPIDGIVTFYAHHVSYRLGRVILSPFTAGSCAGALSAMPNNTYNSIAPFTFWTDKNTTGAFKVTVPKPCKEALGGSQGSILDVYGTAEYEWDRFEVKLHQNRGTDTGVTIRYGVNMTGYNRDLDYLNAYAAVVPYWADPEGGTVVTPGVVYASGYDSSTADPVVMDLSSEFDTQPTAEQVATRASQKMANNRPWLPKDNIDISFVQLWQTEEYANLAALQRLRLCDRVNVIYGPGDVTINGVEIIKTIWDVLLDRYDSMELGSARASFEQMIEADILGGIVGEFATKSYLDQAIDYATDLIKGGLGGHVIIGTDAQGHPDEILIMDTADKNTAVNVWRWNMGGLGHSHNGYNGPFNDVAITMDGKINANMITTGYLNATRIQAGVLQDRVGANYWDLDSGEFRLSSTVTFGGSTIGNYVANNLTQEQVFNILTNNGETQGIYLQNGKLYINGSYIRAGEISANMIKGGTLKLGGLNNVNGVMEVYSDTGVKLGYWDNSGLTLINTSFTSYNNAAGTKYIEITDGEITGQYGQVIDLRAGPGSNKSIYINADELILDVASIYTGLNGNQNLEEGVSQLLRFKAADGYGDSINLWFTNGLLTSYYYD